MTDDELLRKLEALESMLVSVATGGPRIQDVNPQYQREYVEADDELRRRQIDNPIPYLDLWR